MPMLTVPPAIALPAQLGRLVTPTDIPGRRTGNDLPLQGITMLVVEDSRFAADALRLLAQRSGARLRRADSLLAARSHLKVYRPDVVLIDLGLPDGRGEDLIRDLVQGGQRPTAVLGISGDPTLRAAALAAGADGFVSKPIAGLAAFQSLILAHLGADDFLPVMDETAVPEADLIALHDDLSRAAELLGDPSCSLPVNYLAGFVAGIARHAGDPVLAAAARRALGGIAGVDPLRRVLADRLCQTGTLPAGFGTARP
jgi:CheY-like chemotaxis protein